MNPLTSFILSFITDHQKNYENRFRHLIIVENILSVRHVDKRLRNPRGEDINTWVDWSYAPSFAKKPDDPLSVNSLKPDIVCEVYARNAIKRRERFLAEVEQDKENAKDNANS